MTPSVAVRKVKMNGKTLNRKQTHSGGPYGRTGSRSGTRKRETWPHPVALRWPQLDKWWLSFT